MADGSTSLAMSWSSLRITIPPLVTSLQIMFHVKHDLSDFRAAMARDLVSCLPHGHTITGPNPAFPCAVFSQRNRSLRWRVLGCEGEGSISRWPMREHHRDKPPDFC